MENLSKKAKEMAQSKFNYLEADPWSGITKREYMATHILAGIMPSCRHEEEHLHYAVQAVAYADALLEVLSKP